MDANGGKAGDFERRRSSRISARLPTITTNDDSYQPNTGLVIPDDDDIDGIIATPSRIGGSSNQSSSWINNQEPAKRPSSIAKPHGHDHLALNPSFPVAGGRAGPSQSALGHDGPSRGPTHQYGLFQNTVEIEDTPDVTAMVPDTMGGYGRRFDSVETATMVSVPHSEDLPPYTRYPEDAYTRRQDSSTTLNRAPSMPASTTARQIPAGAGGIGLATRNPEYDPSTDDLNSPGSRLSTRSLSDESHHEINVAAKAISEKGDEGKWQRRARKRIWGIVPCWAACLVAAALLLVGVVLGAVIGTFLGKRGDDNDREKTNSNSRSKPLPIYGSDVIALNSLPEGLPSLDTGCYTLPSLITSSVADVCFAVDSQVDTWSCNIPYAMYYVQVDKIDGQPNTTDHVLTITTYDHHNNTEMPKYPWGAAPPVVTNPVRLQLVMDIFESNKGPAWWTRITYNKTVIIGEDKLTPTALIRRDSMQVSDGNNYGEDRDFSIENESDDVRFGAVEGDKPWICTWPDTILEVYIYPEQQSNDDHYPITDPSHSSTPTASAAPAATDWPPFSGIPTRPADYPKVFKFKERRVAELGSSTASCRQIRVIADGQDDEPVLDDDGRPIEVTLIESENSLTVKRQSGHGYVSHSIPRDVIPAEAELSDCGCLWWVF